MSTIGGERVKSTWVTRHVPRDLPVTWEAPRDAIAGDLLLCEVVHTGLHGRVETASGSRQKLYPGDRIVCALANRYATSLLEAVARTDGDHADMVAASGLCGTVVSRTSKASNPTRLRIRAQAYVGRDPLNLRGLSRPVSGAAGSEPRWIIIVGSAMDSGKTTACASVIRGLVDAGHAVGAAKLTGTASGRDYGAFRDAGADPVVDFLDAGLASTAGCAREELRRTAEYLFARVREADVGWGVVEIADGVLQRETRMLLEIVRSATLDADVVVTTRESLSAVAAVEVLASFDLRTVALSGLFTNSPLSRQEAEMASGVCAVRTSELGRWFTERATPPAAANVAEPATEIPADRLGATHP